jgi:4-hydroxy-tetrahydrodipicolinate synthase
MSTDEPMSADHPWHQWTGVFPSLPTPFDDSGGVDHKGMRDVTRFALDYRADGLVCFGLAGEVGRLDAAERRRLLDVIVEEANGRAPVLVGVTAENLNSSCRLAVEAAEFHADGLIVAPPAGHLSEAHLREFFVEVSLATGLPALVQDAPEYLSVAMRPEMVLEVCESSKNVCGVKAEVGPEGIELWRSVLGPDRRVFGGSGGVYLLDCLRAGASGVMPGVDTIDLQVEIAEVERDGNAEEADRLFAALLPMLVFEMQSLDHYNSCAKTVLRARGVDISPNLRRPGPTSLSVESQRRLASYLARIGVPVTGEQVQSERPA